MIINPENNHAGMALVVWILQSVLIFSNFIMLYKLAFRDRKDMYKESLKSITNIVMNKSYYHYGHSSRVGSMCNVICEGLGINGKKRKDILEAAYLHDIGKICVDSTILDKPSTLTPAETEMIKSHSIKGHEILKGFGINQDIIADVLYHHENFDGTGYPLGLAGEAIPIGARIIRVVDSIDAMGSDRAYRKAMPYDVIISEIKAGIGKQYDEKVVKIALNGLNKRIKFILLQSRIMQ